MILDINKLFSRFQGRSGATTESIVNCAAETGRHFPSDYVEFLMLANGGEGFIGEEYIILWGVEEIPSMNNAYEVGMYAPGLLIFGSNGGGEAYGFDTRKVCWNVVQVPFVGMDWSLAESIADSFWTFLDHLQGM